MYVSMKDVASLATISLFLAAIFTWGEIISLAA